MFWEIILASSLVSLIAFLGIVFISLRKQFLEKIVFFLVALAAGALMGQVFFHLLPEAVTKLPASKTFSLTIFSFIAFFLIEKLFFWRHCHDLN